MNSFLLGVFDQFERFFDRAGDDGPVADLDDRSVEQARVRDDRREDLFFGRRSIKIQFFEFLFLCAKEAKRRNAQLACNAPCRVLKLRRAVSDSSWPSWRQLAWTSP